MTRADGVPYTTDTASLPIDVVEHLPLSSHGERFLIAAHRHDAEPVIVCTPCACGGHLEAFSDDLEAKAEAVRIHQRGQVHRAWRAREF